MKQIAVILVSVVSISLASMAPAKAASLGAMLADAPARVDALVNKGGLEAPIVTVGMDNLPRRFQRYPEPKHRRKGGSMNCEEVSHQNYTRRCEGQTALCRLSVQRCESNGETFFLTETTGTSNCCF